jgi:hypothetical protein
MKKRKTLVEFVPVVSAADFRRIFMESCRGERPLPPWAGKLVFNSKKARDEAKKSKH